MRNFLRSALLADAAEWSDARAASPAESRLLLCYDLPAQDGEEALPEIPQVQLPFRVLQRSEAIALT